MGNMVHAATLRVRGERLALWAGIGFLVVTLAFLTSMLPAVSVLIALAAVMVWVQQGQLLGDAVRVDVAQFPEIFRIAEETAERLGMQRPEVFVRQSPILNAFAIGFLGRKSVVLHSALVEALDERELAYILGHEFSHIKCGHTNILVLTNSHQAVNVPIVSQLLSFVFLFWSRKAEYTCDRGGFLSSQDVNACIAAICKLAVGPQLFHKLSIERYVRQRRELDQNDVARLSETFSTHPYLVNRIQAVLAYAESCGQGWQSRPNIQG